MLLAIAGIAAATAATATTTAAAVFYYCCPEYCKARTLISYLRKPHLY